VVDEPANCRLLKMLILLCTSRPLGGRGGGLVDLHDSDDGEDKGKDSIISVSLSKTLGWDDSPTFSVNDNMMEPADSLAENKVSEYSFYSRLALCGSTQDWQVQLPICWAMHFIRIRGCREKH
jgi:hypothetical protein